MPLCPPKPPHTFSTPPYPLIPPPPLPLWGSVVIYEEPLIGANRLELMNEKKTIKKTLMTFIITCDYTRKCSKNSVSKIRHRDFCPLNVVTLVLPPLYSETG